MREMKEKDMTDAENSNNNQTQLILGKLEAKMDNLGSSNDKLANKMDEFSREINGVKNDITEIRATQRPQPAPKWPGILLAILGCVTTCAVVITLIITLTRP